MHVATNGAWVVDGAVVSKLRIRASLQLLATSAGGRKTPISGRFGSYRPNHNFFGPDNREMLMGLVWLPVEEVLMPGESAIVEVEFLNWEALQPELHPGREWLVQEGPQVVGVGTVIEVLTQPEPVRRLIP
jgi:translation elongation factor EF-Tu-like GTPase